MMGNAMAAPRTRSTTAFALAHTFKVSPTQFLSIGLDMSMRPLCCWMKPFTRAASVVWEVAITTQSAVLGCPGAEQCDFIDAAVRAKTSCSISRLLHAKVSMFAKLKRRATEARIFALTGPRLDSTLKSKQKGKTKYGTKR